MTKTTNMTASERQHRGSGIVILAMLGLSIGCVAACYQEVTGLQCLYPPQLATCTDCINYYGTPQKTYCDYRDDPPTGFQTCSEVSVSCFKVWQQQHCFPAGGGPYPTNTTSYCANPGPQHTDPAGTTTKATGNGDCPGG